LIDRKVENPSWLVTRAKVIAVKLQNCHDYAVPDPGILCMKAGIDWFFMECGVKLLPACQPPEDPTAREIRLLNKELDEEMREEALRTQTFEELAAGLGQAALVS
jgi:hypothetical protein